MLSSPSAPSNPQLPEPGGSEKNKKNPWRLLGNQTPPARCPHSPCRTVFPESRSPHPAATDVRFQDTSLSSAELNRRANQLAHYPSCQGPRDPMHRRARPATLLDLVIALLGNRQSRVTAYLPLDLELSRLFGWPSWSGWRNPPRAHQR